MAAISETQECGEGRELVRCGGHGIIACAVNAIHGSIDRRERQGVGSGGRVLESERSMAALRRRRASSKAAVRCSSRRGWHFTAVWRRGDAGGSGGGRGRGSGSGSEGGSGSNGCMER